jgi:hypothetical protein
VTDGLHPGFPPFVGHLGGNAMPGRPRVTIGDTSAVRCRKIFVRGGVAMGMSDLETYIQAMRTDVTGDVLSRSRTMDALLDLRLEAAGRDDVTSLVDAALADLPGKTMVPGDWYRELLDLFELAAVNPVEPVS